MRQFTIVLTRTWYCSVFWVRWIQSTSPHNVSVTCIWLWASNQASHYSNALFPSEFPTKTLYVCLLNPTWARCSVHFILLDFIILIQIINLLISPSSLLGPIILLSTLFSTTFSQCLSFNMKDQVTHTCRSAGKIIALCTLMLTFLDSKRETVDSELNKIRTPDTTAALIYIS